MISGLCLLIAIICIFGITKAMMTGKPPGQQGIKDTSLETNKILKSTQIVFLTLLLVFSLIGCVYFLTNN